MVLAILVPVGVIVVVKGSAGGNGVGDEGAQYVMQHYRGTDRKHNSRMILVAIYRLIQ